MLEEGQTLERCPGPHSCPTCSSQGGVSRDPLTAGSGDRSGLARLADSTIPVACVPRRPCFREAVSRSPTLPSLTKTPKASHCTSLSLVFLLPVREPDAGRHPLFSKLGSRLPFSGNKIRGREDGGKERGKGRGEERQRETLTHVQTHGHYSFEKSNAGNSKG